MIKRLAILVLMLVLPLHADDEGYQKGDKNSFTLMQNLKYDMIYKDGREEKVQLDLKLNFDAVVQKVSSKGVELESKVTGFEVVWNSQKLGGDSGSEKASLDDKALKKAKFKITLNDKGSLKISSLDKSNLWTVIGRQFKDKHIKTEFKRVGDKYLDEDRLGDIFSMLMNLRNSEDAIDLTNEFQKLTQFSSFTPAFRFGFDANQQSKNHLAPLLRVGQVDIDKNETESETKFVAKGSGERIERFNTYYYFNQKASFQSFLTIDDSGRLISVGVEVDIDVEQTLRQKVNFNSSITTKLIAKSAWSNE